MMQSYAKERERTLSQGELGSRVTPHLQSLAELPDELSLFWTPAFPLLFDANRFDLIAKYLYARYRDDGVQTDWHRDLYVDHVRAFSWGKFREDESGKCGEDAFLSNFDATIDSIRDKGFDETQSLIPLSPSGSVLDGSHRVAAAALVDQGVAAVEIDLPCRYDSTFFLGRGLQEKFADAIATEYTRLNRYCYPVILFPRAVGKDAEAIAILNQYGEVHYRKDVVLRGLGPTLFINQLYAGEIWAGDQANDYSGSRAKAVACFTSKSPLRVLFFQSDLPAEALIEAKQRLRDLYDVGKHAVHIGDSREEAERVAQMVCNANSLHLLNHSHRGDTPRFWELLRRFHEWVAEEDLDPNHLCIDGSAILSAYGLRDCRDIDFLSRGSIEPTPEDIDQHDGELHHHAHFLDDLLYNPDNHFWFQGVKFCSLEAVRQMKMRRSESKDRSDVALIHSVKRGRGSHFFAPSATQLAGTLSRFKSKIIYAKRILRTDRKEFVRLVMSRSWHQVERVLPASVGPALYRTLRRLAPVAPSPLWKRAQIVRECQSRFNTQILFHAGTGEGLLVTAVRDSFVRVYATDADSAARDALSQYPGVVVLDGDSALSVERILQVCDSPCLFSFGPGSFVSPTVNAAVVRRMLGQVLTHHVPGHVVMVWFGDRGRSAGTRRILKRLVKQEHPAYVSRQLENVLQILPRQASPP